MRKELPKYVCQRKGRLLYFRRFGKLTRIHAEFGTPEFWAEYALHLRGRPPVPKRNIRGLVQRYKDSPKWAGLSANTKRSYTRHLDWLIDMAGEHDPASITRGTLYDMQEGLKDRPTDANRKIGAISALLAYGVRIEWLKDNPAHGFEKLPATGRKREPWPQDMIEAFREESTRRTRLLFEMLLGTGQRIGDVLRMQWSHMDGDGIRVRQEKTDAVVYVPLTDTLRAALSSAPRLGLFIVAQDNGRPLSYNLAWKDVMEVRDRIGARAWDIHSLRHSAASEIASLPGMTSDHVRAITGHSSSAMVRLYAGPAMQKARAEEAQKARGEREHGNAGGNAGRVSSKVSSLRGKKDG